MKFVDMMKAVDNFTYTENGAGAYSSTGDPILDAFGLLGGMMNSTEVAILNTFYKSFYSDRNLTMRMLFYFRDCRGGQGQRRVFRIILRSLAFNETEYVVNNLSNVLYYGRADDLLVLLGTPAEQKTMSFITYTLAQDVMKMHRGESISMLAKWLPSENTFSKETRSLASAVRKNLNLSSKEYRKLLSHLRSYSNVVETQMSANKWKEISYSQIPAKAALKYLQAFLNHDTNRYIDYLKKANEGTMKIHADVLFPVDIVSRILSGKKDPNGQLLHNALWNALPNYCSENETGICVVDTSGSMHGTPLNVAVSLGIYCADKCRGPFKNHFITFSDRPKLQVIHGNTITEKVNSVVCADWEMSTNLEAVFDLILRTAQQNHCSQEEIPSKLYIISDMQFNESTTGNSRNKTLMTSIEEKYAEAGYTMPALVYWNVRSSSCGMFQQHIGNYNFCCVSGYSASLFRDVINGTETIVEIDKTGRRTVKQVLDPYSVMKAALLNERYDRVWVGP